MRNLVAHLRFLAIRPPRTVREQLPLRFWSMALVLCIALGFVTFIAAALQQDYREPLVAELVQLSTVVMAVGVIVHICRASSIGLASGLGVLFLRYG